MAGSYKDHLNDRRAPVLWRRLKDFSEQTDRLRKHDALGDIVNSFADLLRRTNRVVPRPTEEDLAYLKKAGVVLPFVDLDDLERCASVHEYALDDANLEHIARLYGIERLDLGGSLHRGKRITDAGLKHLVGLINLSDLSLSTTNITDAGFAHLASLDNLEKLNLMSTRVSDAGLIHLKGLKNLRELDLSFTDVTDTGLKLLEEFKSLHSLELKYTKVSEAAVQALRRAARSERRARARSGVLSACCPARGRTRSGPVSARAPGGPTAWHRVASTPFAGCLATAPRGDGQALIDWPVHLESQLQAGTAIRIPPERGTPAGQTVLAVPDLDPARPNRAAAPRSIPTCRPGRRRALHDAIGLGPLDEAIRGDPAERLGGAARRPLDRQRIDRLGVTEADMLDQRAAPVTRRRADLAEDRPLRTGACREIHLDPRPDRGPVGTPRRIEPLAGRHFGSSCPKPAHTTIAKAPRNATAGKTASAILITLRIVVSF